MYKHNASSIKESSDKMFVSQSEKDKWNSKAEGAHTHPNDYFSKEEIMNRLDETNVTYYGNSARIYYSKEAHLKDLNILGNTIHPKEFKRVFPNLTYGKISFTSGLDMDNDDELHKRTDFIEVNYGDTIHFKQVNVSTPLPANVLLYDENKEFISIYNSDTPAVSIVDINLAKIKYIRYFADSTRMGKIALYFERENVNSLISVGTEFKEHDLYEIPITVCGKNLLDLPSVYTRKLEYAYENRMPYSYRIAYCKLEHDASYVISCEYLKEIIKPEGFEQGQSKHGGIHIGLFEHLPEEKDSWYLRQPNLKIAGDELANQTISKVFNSEKYNYLAVYIGMATGDQYDQNVTITNLQLQRGEAKTAYEEYKSTKTSIKIPYELEGLDWANDVLFVREDGMLCINKKIGTYRFTGNEVIRDCSNESYNLEKCVRMQINHSEYKIPNIKKDTGKVVMSNMFKGALNYKDDIPCIFNGSIGFVTNIPKSELNLDNLSTVDAFKVWVKQNEYYIKYIYETPEVIELGPAYDFLGIKSIEGEMNVFVDVNVPNKIRVTVPTTVKSSIDTINRSITAINETVDNVAKNIAIGEEITVSGTASTYASNTVPGFTSNMCIGGRTVVNRIDPIKSWNKKGNVIPTTYVTGVRLAPVNNTVVIYNTLYLNPNTTYKLVVTNRLFNLYSGQMKIKVNLRYNGDIESTVDDCLFDTTVSSKDEPNTNVVVFKTGTSDKYTISVEATGNGEIDIYNFSIFDEYVENLQHDKPFVRLESCDKTIELVSFTEDNLFDGEFMTGYYIGDGSGLSDVYSEDGMCTKNFIPIPEDTKTVYYGFNMPKTNFHSSNMYCYDENMLYLGFIRCGNPEADNIRGGYSIDREVSVIPGTRYVRFRIYMIEDTNNLEVRDAYVNTHGNGYKPFKSTSKEIALHEPLRSLPNGVRDTIEIINGEYSIVRRIGIKTLNGSEHYNLLTSDEGNCRFWIETMQYAKPHGSIVCNRLSHGLATSHKNLSFIGIDQRGNTVIGISKERLEGNEDLLSDAKKWISENNLTFVYEKLQPSVYPIEDIGLSDAEIKLFDNATYVTAKSTGVIRPHISYNIVQNINQSLHSITNKVIALECKDVSVVKSNLNSVYMSDLTSHLLALALYDDEEEFGTVIDFELYDMMYTVVSSGKENYDRAIIENQIDFYTLIDRIDFDMADTLFTMIEEQHSICEIEQEVEC